MTAVGRLVLALAVALLTSACGGGGASGGDGDDGAIVQPADIAVREGLVSRSYAATMTLRAGGAVTGGFEGETPIRIVTLVGGGAPRESWLLSVGLEMPIGIGGGLGARPAIDLIGYHGNDTYKVEAPKAGGLTAEEIEAARKAGREPETTQAVRSTSFVEVSPEDADGEKRSFGELAEPCIVEVDGNGLRGEVVCPRLSDGSESIDLAWSWNADASKVLKEELLESQQPGTSAPAADEGGSASPAQPTTTTVRGATTTPPSHGIPFEGNVPWEARLTPSCITRATIVEVHIETAPDADLSLAVAYSDAKNYGQQTFGKTDAKGEFLWAFTVSPEAPDGDAHVLAVVTAHDRGGGRGSLPFRVVAKC